MTMLDIGDKAPGFLGTTDGGGSLSLRDLKDKKIVLFFYPKDDTPGCAAEAQDFSNAIDEFMKLGAETVSYTHLTLPTNREV